MAQKIAACSALLVFAVCLIAGGTAGNAFSTTLSRALLAMAGSFVIGLIVGAMGQKMLQENSSSMQKKLEDSETKAAGEDR